MNKLRNFRSVLLVATLAPLAYVGGAHAALDEAITTAITTTKTDVLALLAALTVAGAAIWVGRIIYAYFRVR